MFLLLKGQITTEIRPAPNAVVILLKDVLDIVTSAHHLLLVGLKEKPALLNRDPEQCIIQLPTG